MCEYSTDYTYPAVKDMPETTERVYCKRASQFWVQSTISSHNMHACAHHLARIVRSIEEAARPFDILCPPGTPEPDMRYARRDRVDGQIKRVTHGAANGARVTVKPYTPKGR